MYRHRRLNLLLLSMVYTSIKFPLVSITSDNKMLRVCSILLLCFVTVDGYKILAHSPSITPSHLISVGRIADVLFEDGHNVVSLVHQIMWL